MVITIMFRLASATQTILWLSDSRGRKQWPVTRSLLEHFSPVVLHTTKDGSQYILHGEGGETVKGKNNLILTTIL